MRGVLSSTGFGRMWLVVLALSASVGPWRLAMFEELEHKKTSEEKRLLILEIVGATVLCAVLGAAAFWFFDYFGKY